MKIRLVTFTCLVLFAAPVLAAEKTDVLVMKNGDRLTCEIKQLDAGVLYVSIDYVDGTVAVDWKEVARVESKNLFYVQTEDGSRYTGTLSTVEAAGTQRVNIEIAETPEKKVEIARSMVVAISQTSESFWRRFNGAINTGITYSKGNQATQFSLGSDLEYMRERWAARASFDSSLSASSGTESSSRNQLSLSGLRFLPWKNWFGIGVGSLLHSSVQGITLQTTAGGGIGHFLKNSSRTKISVIGGAAWQNTQYETTVSTPSAKNLAAGMLAGEMKFFVFSKTNLDVAASLYPAISDPGRVRFDTRAIYFVKLFGDLSWNITFYGNWDSKPPVGFSSSDYGTTSGISWTFGRW